MGRILEPIGSELFSKLSRLISELSESFIVADTINLIKLVHEHRWYMEEKSILSEVFFDKSVENEKS